MRRRLASLTITHVPALIATKQLRASDVPVINANRIDYSKNVREQLAPLWEFALTFDGYKYFGGDEEVIPRLGQFADSGAQAYREDARIPAFCEIGMLRACLFYEQRNSCKWGKEMSEITRGDAPYFVALAEAIRGRLS